MQSSEEAGRTTRFIGSRVQESLSMFPHSYLPDTSTGRSRAAAPRPPGESAGCPDAEEGALTAPCQQVQPIAQSIVLLSFKGVGGKAGKAAGRDLGENEDRCGQASGMTCKAL